MNKKVSYSHPYYHEVITSLNLIEAKEKTMSNQKIHELNIHALTDQEVLQNFVEFQYPAKSTYKIFFSSLIKGWTANPNLMFLPIDDHIVHRGDGIFEAFKAVNNKIYLLNAHLDRLEQSASRIDLKLPYTREEIEKIVKEVFCASKLSNALIRLFVSRGPGGFSTNPYECMSSQLYVVVMELNKLAESKYQKGVTAGRSEIELKQGWMAQVKSCNYLPNVMMKMESIKKSWDFSIGFDQAGCLTEGPTENLAIMNSQGIFIYPEFRNCLKGTTLSRLVEIIHENKLCSVQQRNIFEKEILEAREVFMIGTTLDVIAVVEWNGQKISDGTPGSWAREFRKRIEADMR